MNSKNQISGKAPVRLIRSTLGCSITLGPGVMARMMIPREETKADGPVSGAEDTKGIRFINRG